MRIKRAVSNKQLRTYSPRSARAPNGRKAPVTIDEIL